MKPCPTIVVSLACLAVTSAAGALPQQRPGSVPAPYARCENWTITQRSYRAFGERLAIYVGDIRTNGGARTYALRVLVGTYRRPFLTSTGVLTETGVDQLLSQRRDVTQQKLESGSATGFQSVLSFQVDGRPARVRVVGGTAGAAAGEVCGSW